MLHLALGEGQLSLHHFFLKNLILLSTNKILSIMDASRKYSGCSVAATKLQIRTRDTCGFPPMERDMVSCSRPRRSLSLQPKLLVSDSVSNVLSYLGSWNPWPQPVTKTDEVWLMDNTAFQTTQKDRYGKEVKIWQAEFVAAVFSQHPSRTISDAVVQLAEKTGLADDEEAKRTIEKRLRPFLIDIQPGKQVVALHGKDAHLRLTPGGTNGISTNIKTIPAVPAGLSTPTTAEVPRETTGLLQCKTFFSEPEGWAVISDIDDTIKVTLTSKPTGILQTTFVDKPTPVPGMPELYRFLQKEITSASPFFYLSASPYNLYPFLREFRNAHYPQGQLLLRDSSWMSIPGLLTSLTLGTHEYKMDRVGKIHGWFPRKKMICIGDSTQSDPEVYGDAYQAYGPEWIKLILIRKVTDISAIGIEDKNKQKRFEKAFEGIPEGVCHVFEDPNECYEIIQKTMEDFPVPHC